MTGPWLGDNRRDFHAKFHIGATSGLTNLTCEHGEPRGLRRPVGSAQERGSTAFEVLGGGVVTQVCREVHVNSRGASRLERAIPCATKDCHACHPGTFISADQETGGACRQHGCDVVCEGSESRLVDGADAPEADLVSLGVGSTRLQRHGIAQTEQVGECRRNAVAGDVRVGVRVEQGDTGADQSRDDATLGVVHRQEGRAAQEQRVVGDHHVVGLPVTGRTGNGLLSNNRGGIKREENRPHGGCRVADDESNAIPGLRGGRRVPRLHECHHVADGPLRCGRIGRGRRAVEVRRRLHTSSIPDPHLARDPARDYDHNVQILSLLDQGLVDYTQVDALQRSLHEEVLAGGEDTLIVSQFTPTWTAGRHTKPQDIPSTTIPVIRTDRAGSATWHGPGQVVVYPVVRLREPVDLVQWIRAVEASVIDTVREVWGLPVHRIEGRAGVWLTEEGRRDRKICAIGLKVARGATLHGIALNVDIDSAHAFEGIIPCGLTDADVTSLSWEGIHTTVQDAANELVPRMVEHISPCLATTPTSVSYTTRSTL